MRNVIIIFILFFVFIMDGLDGAELIEQGLKAGINNANFTSSDVNMGTDERQALTFGAFAVYRSTANLDFQGELNYSMKGAVDKYEDETLEFKIDYLEIPVLARLSAKNSNFSPFVLAGPYVGFKLSSKAKYSSDEENYEGKIENIKPIDLGAAFAAGFSFYNLFVEFRFSKGLSKIFLSGTNEYNMPVISNSVFTILFGFKMK